MWKADRHSGLPKPFIVLAAFLTLMLFPAGSALAAPQIIMGKNLEGEVIFKGNNCVVYYRPNGSRRQSLPSCRPGQIQKADTAMAAYRREQGIGQGGGRPPQIVAKPNGAVKVMFPNNKCVIHYNRNGVFKDQTPWCSAAHRSRAAKAVAAYRREQGIGGGGGRPPQIIAKPNGALTVRFHNNKCIIGYTKHGVFKQQTPWCSAAHRSRAAKAVAAYRREQGLH